MTLRQYSLLLSRFNAAERQRKEFVGLIVSWIARGQRAKHERAKLPHHFFPELKEIAGSGSAEQSPEHMLNQVRLMFGETKTT